MIRKILFLSCSLYSLSCFACPQAVHTSHPHFCDSFHSVAQCHCADSLPHSMCKDMQKLYARMISMFGSVERACRFQQDTSTQNCIDDWKCYREGGVNTQGELCSGTGDKC